MSLVEQSCEICDKNSPKVTLAELQVYKKEIPDWRIIELDGILRLERTYTFLNFVKALAFTNKVGELAETQGHHPAILLEWGRANVSWWTHSIGGLHKNDFIMAVKTDALFRSTP